MAGSFTTSTVDNIKTQVDIVDVIGSVVSLKKTGANHKGLCPFHGEKTPSFVVSEQKQIFSCFGCGASGDVIEFVKRYYNLDFREAVEKLAAQYNIPIQQSSRGEDLTPYYDANRLAAQFFYRAFTEQANKGYSYMKKRGLTPATMKKFGLGYADENWTSLFDFLTQQGISKKIILELGLASESKGRCYDKFRNRVMFPIINTSGKVIGFGGRAIDPEDNPKYLNSPESKVFRKKNNLYGLNLARQAIGKEDRLVLVEGYMDVIGLCQGGVENACATLGTALTENQAKLIKRYTKHVFLSYDADSAGRNAALRGMDILRAADCKVKVLHVTDGKDPDEFIQKNGRAAFLKLLDGAKNFGDYKLEAARIGYDLSKDEEKLEYIQKAAAILESFGPAEQDIYTSKLAKELGVSESALRRETARQQEQATPTRQPRREAEDQQRERKPLTSMERNLLKLVVDNGSYVKRIQEVPYLLETDGAKALFLAISQDWNEYGTTDANRILDRLDEPDRSVLADLLENTPPGGDEEALLRLALHQADMKRLRHRERELQNMLSLADDAAGPDSEARIQQWMTELKDIQDLIQLERNRGQ